MHISDQLQANETFIANNTTKLKQKILIIRLSSIGDIVLTTPVIRCIKKQLPDVEVHYLTKYGFRHILQHNPYIDKLHLLEDNISKIITQLTRENFDYIIDLHHNLRTLKIKSSLKGVTAFSFNKLNIKKWLLTTFKIDRMPKKHIVDRYIDTVISLGVTNDGEGLDYFIGKEEQISDDDIPAAHSLGYIGVVIGAALNTKKLPLHKLQELCKAIDHPIILLGGPEDRDNGNAIAAFDDVKIYNACGKFSLNESADLVRKARLIITHDTGLMHIAAAYKKPIISIWGNTVPAFGMTPYYGYAVQPSHIMEVNGLSCRPCSKIGYSKCPRGHFKCMEKQSIDEIVKRAMAILSNK